MSFSGTAKLLPDDRSGGGVVAVVELELTSPGDASAGWRGRAWADRPWILRYVGSWVTVRTADGEGRALLASADGHLAGTGAPPWTE